MSGSVATGKVRLAIARMVGWTAHVLEQWSNNKLIRPLSHYTGPVDLEVPPIEER